MKTLFYSISIMVCLSLFSCKKPGTVTQVDGGPETIDSHFITFVIVDKNGNNIIHSVNDTLVVTYVLNGATVANRLNILKVQASEEDATRISKYNGFIVSDEMFIGVEGYITAASGGVIKYHPLSKGVRNFNLYLNGVSIGLIYLDYWNVPSGVGDSTAQFPNFTLNGTPARFGYLSGFVVPGYPAILSDHLSGYNSKPDYSNINQVFLLQL